MSNLLMGDFITGLLIFLRITAMMFSTPIFSNSNISPSIRLFFSLIITYILYFTVPKVDFNPENGLIPLALLGFKEIITGLLMGFVLYFVFWGISYAGSLIGFDMGLAMAEIFDPTTEAQNNIIGEMILLLATLIFILINGHHFIIRALAASFQIIPLGHFSINQSVIDMLIKFSTGIFILAVKISAPILVSFFLIHIGAGIISRIIPQMQVFFVIQPLKIGMGFLFLILVLPIYVTVIKNLLMSYEDNLYELLKAMSL
ncbi:MAG: flagellar biosynthetic protein FliR [bacterium]